MSPRAVSDMRGEYKVKATEGMPKGEMKRIIDEIEKQMKEAAKNLEFEKAAALRDELYEMKALFADEENLKPWERLKLLTGEGQ